MNIEELILQAQNLQNEDYRSPKVELWEKRVKNFILENYGKDYIEIFENALSWGSVIMPGEGPRMHFDAMSRAMVFLESLKSEPNLDLSPQSSHINIKMESLDNLHPLIKSKCSSLDEKKELSEAVEKGFKVVRDRLRQLSGYETGAEAFGKGKLYIKGAAAIHVDFDFNEGVKFLTM